MNDRQRLEAIVSVVCKYLPPDGTPIKEAMSEIISLIDPLPPLPVQPVQEPVAWMTPDGEGLRIRFSPPVNDVPFDVPLGWDALYTTPPQRKPLTDEQILEMCGIVDFGIVDFVRAVEVAHGIKENT